MSTPTRTRVVTFQRSHRQRPSRPAPLPLGQRASSTLPASPSSASHSATTKNFFGPTNQGTPHPFSSFTVPLTSAPCVEDPRSPKPRCRREVSLEDLAPDTPHIVFPKTPFPVREDFGTTPTDIAVPKIATFAPEPQAMKSPLAPQPFSRMFMKASLGGPSLFRPSIGVLWSPAPVRDNLKAEAPVEDSIKSPGVPTPSTSTRFQFTSPAPRDPLAAYPTFGGVLAAEHEATSLHYPPSVLIQA